MLSSSQSQFVPGLSDDVDLWEVKRVLDERDGLVKVDWAGVDPRTMKRYRPTWVKRRDVTDDVVLDFRAKKARQEGMWFFSRTAV